MHDWIHIFLLCNSNLSGCLCFHKSYTVVSFSCCRYALGGFDGSTMVPSIEVYDPRLQLWMSEHPMSHSRGYCAAAVVKESMYVIGGVRAGADIVDTVN